MRMGTLTSRRPIGMAGRSPRRYHAGALRKVCDTRREGDVVRVGIGYDLHRMETGRPLILGGVKIEHSRGLVGHSDADVVLHAVADALLGAACLGDIGEHYPDTAPQWAGLDSQRLLSEVVDRLARAGWRPVQCDLIVHAQEPKLSAHKPAIRANLARLLHVDSSVVNVKAKTGETIGTIGRGEAIACQAVVVVEAIDKGP
jgi:2-C-methyl-D-erythritol 2,4-cyclodiphosphate synthase